MAETAGIGGILNRIARIESRFGATTQPDAGLTAPPMADFDPFGEAYQQAVERSRLAAPAVATAPTSLGNDRAVLVNPRSDFALNRISGPIAAGGSRPIGGYGRMPVPAELQQYGNGRIPTDRLEPIAQSGHRLFAPAAAAWDGLVAEARTAGFDLRITDSYRSYDQQVDLARRKGLYSEGGLAATPGTSNHGWGLAVDADVTDPALLAWVRANAPRFGFVEAVPREPWHWEYRPHQV
jgi:hypothetical protein